MYAHTVWNFTCSVQSYTTDQYRIVRETSPVAEEEHPAVFKVGEVLWRARALPPIWQLDLSNYIGL